MSVRRACRRRAEHGGHRARARRGDLMLSERTVTQSRRPVRVFVLMLLKLLKAVMLLLLLLLKLWLLLLLCVVLLRVCVGIGGMMAKTGWLNIVARVLRVQRHGTVPPSADEARDLRRRATGARTSATTCLRAKAERGA